jgi:hypothetical protein
MSMPFKTRLKFYGIGFIIGLTILISILNKGGCTGLNERKAQELALQVWKISEAQRCKLKCIGLTTDTLFIKAVRDCYVNYGKSDVHAEPCGSYVLESAKGVAPSFTLLVADCQNTSELLDIATPASCDCK